MSGPRRNRTVNLPIKSRLLCQLSYRPVPQLLPQPVRYASKGGAKQNFKSQCARVPRGRFALGHDRAFGSRSPHREPDLPYVLPQPMNIETVARVL